MSENCNPTKTTINFLRALTISELRFRTNLDINSISGYSVSQQSENYIVNISGSMSGIFPSEMIHAIETGDYRNSAYIVGFNVGDVRKFNIKVTSSQVERLFIDFEINMVDEREKMQAQYLQMLSRSQREESNTPEIVEKVNEVVVEDKEEKSITQFQTSFGFA